MATTLRFMYLGSVWLLSLCDFCTDSSHLEKFFFIDSMFLHNMLIRNCTSVFPLLHSSNRHLKVGFILPLPFFPPIGTSQSSSKIFLRTDWHYFGQTFYILDVTIPASFSLNASDFHMTLKPHHNAFHFFEKLLDTLESQIFTGLF